MKTFINYFSLLSLFLFLTSLIKLSNQLNSISLTYPNSLTLLDYSNVVVAGDGIHFFDNNLENEEESKKINFTIVSEEELAKLVMAQFPSEYGGYILIFIQNIIYIFDNDKNNLKIQNVSDSINGNYYSLTPYKKDNNNLIFIISYKEIGSNSIILANCIFDLSNLNSDLIINSTSRIVPNYEGGSLTLLGNSIDCLLMSPLSTLNINNDLLTCFGTMEWETRLFSATFNPENNFEEIESLRDHKQSVFIQYNAFKVIAKTDNNKKKVIIYIIFGGQVLWATFDYINKLSNVYKEEHGEGELDYNYWKHKIFYFQQTSEFLLTSSIPANCKQFIMFFNINFNIEYKGVLQFDTENGCRFAESFTIFYNGYNYTALIYGNKVAKSKSFNETNELENIDIDNPNIDNSSTTILTTYTQTDSPTTITTTYTEKDNPTTIITTYIQKDNPTSITTTYNEKDNPTTYIEKDNPTTIENYSENEKCKKSTVESWYYTLCTECNIEKNYFEALFPKDDFLHGFKECYNETTKPINFYFDNSTQKYKPCYEACLTCNEGGNEDNNNCLTCEINFRKRPEYSESNNCVPICFYLYYYTQYGQYKCTNNSHCPEEANLY